MKNRLVAPLVFTLSLFLSLIAAAFPPTYGAEFEFTNKKLSEAPASDTWHGLSVDLVEAEAKVKMKEALLAKCRLKGCRVQEVDGKWDKDYKIVFRDGWYFTISHDPGVVEIMTKPSTLAELREQKSVVNEMIFGIADAVGLSPNYPRLPPAGHFNFGIRSAFGNDGLLFLRFLADYSNRPFLALGVLGEDLLNAPPMSFLENGQQDELRKIIAETSAESARSPKRSIKYVSQQVLNRVYTESYDPSVKNIGYHYQAVSIKKVRQLADRNDVPAELRAVFMQRNAEEFILLAELFEARLAYLKKQDAPIEYNPPKRKRYRSKELVDLFHEYVTEMDGDWEKFRELLRGPLAKIQPSGAEAPVVRKPRRRAPISCRSLL